MRQIDVREAVTLLRAMTWVLCVVGALALVCTTVNVTRFATSREVPLPIAVLLDPMIGTALAGVLYVDARLASWGIDPPAWSAALRWGAGCVAALMNSWESLWPDGQIGWPHRADPAAVLLHLTPALLLIALTETIAAYRRCVTDLLDQIDSVRRTTQPTGDAGPTDGQTTADATSARPTRPHAQRTHETDSPTGQGRTPTKPPTGHEAHRPPTLPTAHRSANGRATDRDLWTRALALDASTRAATGRPVSLWKLRTELHIGPRHARQIHDRLMADPPTADTTG